MTDCKINKYSSRVCSLGTKSCVMKHEGIAERNEEITRLRQRVKELEAERTKQANPEAIRALQRAIADNEKDAERYRWGLEHPSLMANFFIKWKTNHEHYNHKNPGVHPSEAIDAAMEKERGEPL